MAKGEVAHSKMAYDRQIDGIKVIFDQSSPVPSRSRSRSNSGSKPTSGSGRSKGRVSRRRRYRSSSSSSSSSSHSRSRSHPRCHRPSSRCRCDNHRRNDRSRQAPPRRDRAGSRSSSHRNRNRNKRAASPSSKSQPRTHSGSSRSGSSEDSVNLRLDDKGELVRAAKAIATTILGVEKEELPESVEPVLSEESVEFKRVSIDTWVRQDPEKTESQSDEEESDDVFSPRMSPKRKTISFSINNSLVKPTLAAQSGAKVTSRVDSFDSRKPYGHWVRVKSGKSMNARKHTFSTTH
ncbi:hypothetical protein F7725_007812 [Dissostichus mawsoni]|uniref:Arginine/serine-rich protein 1 n=2 Tax=Dissostichus TaxID=36199 RepID=A0A7J5Y7E6_DISMA|nr:hypothetical protein F7725_007812 [Dissostichus mawsoni]KAK1894373.1 Arginine/serine-rich protein 1 [Dissostichus eleginoides]